jgi:hypothetical protein
MALYRFLGVFSVLWLLSCTKTEITEVPDNTAPPDYTIEKSVVRNYVVKAYISALGRQPSVQEKEEGENSLFAAGFSKESRANFIQSILMKEEFNQNNYKIARAELLNNFDTTEIYQRLYIYNLLLNDPQYALFYDLIHKEKQRLYELQAIPQDMANGTLTIEGMLRRCVNNSFYDDINMGSENFVVSNFQHFLLRYPTQSELEQGKLMVEGFEGTLLFRVGSSKNDFIDIVFSSDNFKEGMVRKLFARYMFRNPTQEELYVFTEKYKVSGSYKELTKEIMITDEYSGLK